MSVQARRDLDDMIRIQSQDGNWNFDPYMQGLLNGMLLARSIYENDQTFKGGYEAPEHWLAYISLKDKLMAIWKIITN